MAQIEMNFCNELKDLVGNRLEVRLNDNHSTMLSVKWGPKLTKVSLHRIFLTAPVEIQTALASYLRRDEKELSANVKAFIEKQTYELDYSHQVNRDKLFTVGAYYDLQEIYELLNERYFNGQLSLSLTWFGSSLPKNRSRCTLGLYYALIRLVKVHRVLDTPLVPRYVVEYVVYHEMLHAVCPSMVDEKGYHHVHTHEFKRREKLFYHYSQANNWIKQHRMSFFVSQRNYQYGRTQQVGKYQAPKKQSRRQERQNIFTSF